MNELIQQKLGQIYQEYCHLNQQLQDPQIARQITLYTDLSQKISLIRAAGIMWEKRLALQSQQAEWKLIKTSDPQMQEAAEHEISLLNQKLQALEQKLTVWWGKYVGQSGDKNTIMEFRAATGGAEASLFVTNILNMYTNYFKKQKWPYNFLDRRINDSGGYTYVALIVKHPAAFNKLQYEAGVHRVQRVPKTETQGRLHTSTITLAVLKERQEQEVPLSSKDLRIDTFRSSGAGGQSVNTTDSAVRVTHLPTGMMVSCQDGRSQHDNKERALQVLRARLYRIYQSQVTKQHAQERQAQIGWGFRSEKIRTYNYPQNRITDHRIKMSFHGIETIMNGNLELIITQLIANLPAKDE